MATESHVLLDAGVWTPARLQDVSGKPRLLRNCPRHRARREERRLAACITSVVRVDSWDQVAGVGAL